MVLTHSASVKKTAEGKWVGCSRSRTSRWGRGVYQDSKSQTYVPSGTQALSVETSFYR